MGAGITGGLSLADQARGVAAGVYAEAGTTYFLFPRIGVSGVGELNVGYSEMRLFSVDGGPGAVRREWSARGNLARLAIVAFF